MHCKMSMGNRSDDKINEYVHCAVTIRKPRVLQKVISFILHTFEQDRPNKSRKEMRKSAMNRIRGGVQGIGQGKEKVLWKKKGLLEEGK